MAQNKDDDIDDDLDDLNADDEIQMPNLFWSMNLTPGSDHEVQEPELPGWIVHITNACYGVNVKNNSRTVVISQVDDEETPLCVLLEGKNENVTLDLIFSEAIKIKLAGKNPSPVSLTGYLQPPPHFDDDIPSTMGGEDIAEIEDNEEEEQINNLIRKRKLLQAKKDAEEDEAPQLLDESKDDNVKVPPTKRAKTDNKQQQKGGPKQQQQQQQQQQPTQQEQPQQLTKQQKKKQKQQQKQQQNQNKKNEENAITTNSDNKQNEKGEGEEEKEKGTTTVNITSTTTTTTITTAPATTTNEKDANNKTQQLPKESEKKQDNNNNNKNNKTEKKENLKTMKGGIKYKDLKEGKGEVVQHGQKLHIYYVGQLEDKSIFDKVITGKPLEFEYGKGEVVKGLDTGITGMKIGGKRRIIIPPKLGYGDKATEKIPANSTLTYTIEIRPNK